MTSQIVATLIDDTTAVAPTSSNEMTVTTQSSPNVSHLLSLSMVLFDLISAMLEPWEWSCIKRASHLCHSFFGGHHHTVSTISATITTLPTSTPSSTSSSVSIEGTKQVFRRQYDVHFQRMKWWNEVVACSSCDQCGRRRTMISGEQAIKLCRWVTYLCSKHRHLPLPPSNGSLLYFIVPPSYIPSDMTDDA
jgi:hypothetical protein